MLKWWMGFRQPMMDSDGGAGNGGAGTGGEGGDGGGQGGGDPQKTYDEAYVKKLRDEAAGHRTKVKDLEQKLAGASQETMAKVLKALGLEPDPNKNYEQQLADANKKAQEAEEKANQRLIKAEVKVISAQLGIIDSDAALALMDKGKVKVNDSGDVEGAKEALEALLKDKPYLKGQPDNNKVGSGSNPAGGGGTKNNATSGMNDFIRKMAGR